MASLTNVVVVGGDAAAAVARVEMLRPAGYAGLAVSSGLDVQNYVGELQPDLVLVEGDFDDVDRFEVIRRLKQDPSTRHIPLIMLNAPPGSEALEEGFEAGLDDMLEAGVAEDVLLARLQPLVRLSTMHFEFHRRIETASKIGVNIDIDGAHDVDAANCRVLFVGPETARVSALAEALSAAGFNPVLETDHFRAGTRLAEESFDAAVIAVDDEEPLDKAMYLCAHIRNNTRLFNLPVLVAARKSAESLGNSPYQQGASLAVPLTTDDGRLAAGLKFLVRRQRLRWNLHGPLTATLQTHTADSISGLYSEGFLRSHLEYLLSFGKRRRRNLSLALFSIQNVAVLKGRPDDVTSLMQQVADRICSMVRVEDLAARLDDFDICVILPGAAEREALQAMDRITGALQTGAFKRADGAPLGSPLWLQSSAVAAVQGEAADELIVRARNTLA